VTTGNGWPGADGPLRAPGSAPRVAPPSVGTQHQAPRPPPAAPPVAAPPPVAPSRPAPPRPAPPPSTAAAARAATVGPGSRRGGRRARLVVKRIDPWSTLKFSFVYSLAGLVVVLVAAAALYAIVDAMGVIHSLRTFIGEVEGSNNNGSIAAWLSFGRVMTVALVVGLVNVVLFTAFATLTAFIYNVCTDLVGGIEVTLADRN
jgi:hypothetical protein